MQSQAATGSAIARYATRTNANEVDRESRAGHGRHDGAGRQVPLACVRLPPSRRGLTIRNQIQSSASREDRDHEILEPLEDPADLLPVRPHHDAGDDEQQRPRQRAEEREHDEAAEGHVRDAGRERHERPDHRHHPSEERSRVAVAVEEVVGAVEVLPA